MKRHAWVAVSALSAVTWATAVRVKWWAAKAQQWADKRAAAL